MAVQSRARGRNLLNGANFASAASGYYEPTAHLYVKLVISYDIKLKNNYNCLFSTYK